MTSWQGPGLAHRCGAQGKCIPGWGCCLAVFVAATHVRHHVTIITAGANGRTKAGRGHGFDSWRLNIFGYPPNMIEHAACRERKLQTGLEFPKFPLRGDVHLLWGGACGARAIACRCMYVRMNTPHCGVACDVSCDYVPVHQAFRTCNYCTLRCWMVSEECPSGWC
jgi:hypothetical protein